MNYKEKYEQALERAKDMLAYKEVRQEDMEYLFPELEENKDERIRKGLIKAVSGILKGNTLYGTDVTREQALAWLEKQGEQSVEPKWCHHKVDLSDCSEEYRKAYYDGWNNCNMQHSQREAESNNEDERMRKEIIDFLRLPHPQFVGKRDHEKWIDWLEKQGDNKECGDEWKVSTGLYKCTKRMFDDTPESRLLFEPGNLYKCVKIHKCVTNNDVAVFESPYWLPVFLTDSIVRKHFIKV